MSGSAGASLLGQRCPAPRRHCHGHRTACYRAIWQTERQVCPSTGSSKGLLKTSSEGKCIPLPVITLRWHRRGLGRGEQALNVSALFIARYVSCCISSGRQLPVGKYFCAFLGVPPPPTGKDLCKTLPSHTGEAVRPPGTRVRGKSSEWCVRRASLPVVVERS